MTTPSATYRVQLHAGFGFDHVAALAPYLAQLGISHVYCSPYLQAVPGSTHGYDVVDHSRLNEELGGEPAFERMVAALARHGLSHIADIVPNHMAIAGRHNAWWWDVLENGQSSRWASAFDIDWSPPEERLRQRVLLPVLGDHVGRVLESGELRLHREGASFLVRYHEHEAPVSPPTLDDLLARAARVCRLRGPNAMVGPDELASIGAALGRLAEPAATDLDSIAVRHRDQKVLVGWLGRLLEGPPAVADAVDATVDAFNADPAVLDGLLRRQNFRMARWRTAARELDYRRFFDVPSLVALHMERPHVFRETHSLIESLVSEGKVQGLRVDHPDGLRDPTEYLERLRRLAGEQTWLGVEKIVEQGERLPGSWPVAGTTGYDFLNRVTGLFVDPEGEAALTDLHARFTGDDRDFPTVAHEAKHLVLDDTLNADVNRIVNLMVAVCERHRRHRDHTRHDLHEAIAETAACFPVYRTYFRAGVGAPNPDDVTALETAVEEARGRRPDVDADLFDFLRDVLLLRVPGDVETAVALRFQQLTAPVMAKGVEDTAFYRYVRLACLCEVGGDPGTFGTAVADFHGLNAEVAERWPATMLSTSTHDTKRSEDVRARIALLSENPGQWALAVRRWASLNDRHRRDGWPDRTTEYLLYQTLVGAWPIGVERAEEYVRKAVKEAKRHTSWTAPDEAYEAAVSGFVADALADPELTADVDQFVRPLVGAGRITSLSMTLLKLTSPGVPDTYQGTELWDLSLVDPDNRRPVDFELRRRLMEAVAEASPTEVIGCGDEGAPKLWLIQRVLTARRRRAASFAPGSAYLPLWAQGENAHHLVAYQRGEDVIALAPRLVVGLGGDWGDATVVLPPGRWGDELGGARAWSGGAAVRVAELLQEFPVGLLGRLGQ